MKKLLFTLALCAGSFTFVNIPATAAATTYYDPEGNEIEFLLIKEDNGAMYEYEFDSQGRMSKKVETQEENGSSYTLEYEYGADGRLSKCNYVDDGEVYSTDIYEYDDENNEVNVVLSEGKKHRIEKYDDDGNLIREESYDIEGELTRFWDYSYDEDGNLTEAAYMDGGCWSYSYEDGKRTLGSHDDPDGDCDAEQTYEYDDYGNIITEINWDEGEKSEYHYEYMSVDDYLN